MNIKDVARVAGVSVSTVSFVLNKRPGVSKDTRLKVLSVVEKLDYIPNQVARSLVTRRTHSIGLIIPDTAELFYGKLARIIQDAVGLHAYSLVIGNSDNYAAKEKSCLDFLVEKNVEGIIMVPGTSSNIERVKKIRTPMVFVDRQLEGVDISYVGVDNRAAGYKSTKHLVDLGHDMIGCITGPTSASSSQERVQGYQEALMDSHLSWDPLLLKNTDWTVEGGYRGAKELLSLKNRPTAIFVTGDTCAIGVFDALREEGLSVPGDVALVGFDDLIFASFLRVPLTTVRQPLEQMGTLAVRLLFERLESSEPKSPERVILPTELVIRESCGQAARRESLAPGILRKAD
jgi:LacI family transcriptional regulator